MTANLNLNLNKSKALFIALNHVSLTPNVKSRLIRNHKNTQSLFRIPRSTIPGIVAAAAMHKAYNAAFSNPFWERRVKGDTQSIDEFTEKYYKALKSRKVKQNSAVAPSNKNVKVSVEEQNRYKVKTQAEYFHYVSSRLRDAWGAVAEIHRTPKGDLAFDLTLTLVVYDTSDYNSLPRRLRIRIPRTYSWSRHPSQRPIQDLSGLVTMTSMYMRMFQNEHIQGENIRELLKGHDRLFRVSFGSH